MFASLLPGVRELRVPLTTGYLWLAVIWLYLASDTVISAFKRSDLSESLSLLGTLGLVGSTAGLAALTFTAYVIGIISTSNGSLYDAVILRLRRWVMPHAPEGLKKRYGWTDWSSDSYRLCGVFLRAPSRSLLEQLQPLINQAYALVDSSDGTHPNFYFNINTQTKLDYDEEYKHLKARLDRGELGNHEGPLRTMAVSFMLHRQVLREERSLATLLRTNAPTRHEEYDRKVSEFAWREAVALPVGFLVAKLTATILFIVSTSIQVMGWAQIPIDVLVGLLVAAALVWSARKTGEEATDVLMQALVDKAIHSPALVNFREQAAQFRGGRAT